MHTIFAIRSAHWPIYNEPTYFLFEYTLFQAYFDILNIFPKTKYNEMSS